MNNAQAITLEYSEDLPKRAVRDYWLHMIGVRWPVGIVVMLAFLAYLVQSGDRNSIVALVGLTVVVSSTMLVVSYIVPRRDILRKFQAMRSRTATIELLGYSFRISSDEGSRELRRDDVRNAWSHSDYLIIDIGPRQFYTLPVESLSDSDRATLANYFSL